MILGMILVTIGAGYLAWNTKNPSSVDLISLVLVSMGSVAYGLSR